MERVEARHEQLLTTPEEEKEFLEKRVEENREFLGSAQGKPDRASVAGAEIREYARADRSSVLAPELALSEEEVDAIALDLPPEAHDENINELLHILVEKGIKNALDVASRLGPHIEDDFHRFLVQYIAEGYEIPLSPKKQMKQSLNMRLFRVFLSEGDQDSKEKRLEELLSATEQLYASLLSPNFLSDVRHHVALELAVSDNRKEIVFYIGVAHTYQSKLERLVLSTFPKAVVKEEKGDYNIFVQGGETAGVELGLSRDGAFPIKTYDEFENDPLNIILSTFSRLHESEEGASVQYILSPVQQKISDRYRKGLEKIQAGTKASEALSKESIAGKIFSEVGKSLSSQSSKKDDDKSVDTLAVEQIGKKIKAPIICSTVRIVASAKTRGRAHEILHDIASAFEQFGTGGGNSFSFKEIKGRALAQFLRSFSFRMPSRKELPLNLRELATLMHFTAARVSAPRELKIAGAKSVAAPFDLPKEGLLLGTNTHGGAEEPVYLSDEDRLRHLYVIGQTGTGKSTLLKNMILQDIKRGAGVAMIDPHGADLEHILGAIPEERVDDVVYFDPSNMAYPMGLNILEYDLDKPEQKTFVANELLNIFTKLYGDVPESIGPMFQQYFRNAALLVLEHPESGSTLLDVPRVLADTRYRQFKLSQAKNPVVVQFWRDIAEQAGGESALENIVPYITSKTDVFLANEIMRPILSQQHSTIDFSDIMNTQKILLVNLSKGRLGEVNANLIGLIVVGKILMSALSRDTAKSNPPFYFYIDEFQNVTTDSIATIFSEARKYGLSLTVAHQFIAQLEKKIRDAVFGNVGSLCAFRVGRDDAEYLEPQFNPPFDKTDLAQIENRHAYVRLLADGRPQPPFNLSIGAPDHSDRTRAEDIASHSARRYGRMREEVTEEIEQRFQEIATENKE